MAEHVAIEPRQRADAGKARRVGEEAVAADPFVHDGDVRGRLVRRSRAASSAGHELFVSGVERRAVRNRIAERDDRRRVRSCRRPRRSTASSTAASCPPAETARGPEKSPSVET